MLSRIAPSMLSRARRVADAPRAAASLRRASRRFGAAPRLAVAERSARYAELSSDDVAAFRTMTSSVLEGAEACRPYNVDWMSKWEGRARVVLRPASTAEVSAILTYCDARRLAVVPQGGKTGLVGGSVPVHDEVVLSLARMDRIEAFDADTGVATLEAGVVLGDLDAFLRDRGFVAPLDLGASGTCTVGGNLATNAGGVRFVRYGSLRGSCVGVEFVKARAGQESEIPNFKGSYLGRFPLVLADFWTSDHLLERSRSMNAFSGTRARGTLTLKRR